MTTPTASPKPAAAAPPHSAWSASPTSADGLPVPETLHRLIQTLLDYHDGQLQDDATILICQWLSPANGSTAAATDRT
ncbi:hypothetical protein [Streptomyces canus]|uniref:hypothetical protein n=1 Tax=Streptomyces canus TaxID=58343 RepID=UPI003AF26964